MSAREIACGFPEFLWIWNRVQGMETPALHRRIARWLGARWRAGDRHLLLQAFRASGKSTIVGVFCAWLLFRDPALRVLVLAAEQDLATKMVRNVKRVIERHPLTAGLKPDRADQWASGQFTVRRALESRDPSMLARGIGANLTGCRADVLICDDVEVPNTSDSAPKRQDLRQRLSETDYVLTAGGTQLYVGTPHSYYTIYAEDVRPETDERAPFLDGFRRLTLPILTAGGVSRWPEKYDAAVIDGLRRRHGSAKFDSQMMLRPVNIAGCRLDPDRLRPYEAELVYSERNRRAELSLEGVRLASATCRWDPAYGAPDAGDRSVVVCVFTDEAGGYWLHDAVYLSVEPDTEVDEARQQCRAVARFAARHHLPAVTVETNGIGRFLPGLLRAEIRALGLAVGVVEAHSTRAKERRILEALDAPLAAGQIRAHARVWRTPLPREMREWRPDGTGKTHDDGLDALAGCLIDEPVRLPRTPAPDAVRPGWRGAPGLAADTDFDL
ncbi:phage terminase large subunit [Marivibrio halodurans]|uniref:Phage terminase large subunit n=1 Tax=Marivibrio halodurans TaxID=2039722 RepID=A0A8J7RXL1_9PROT|nr:phage terminase large subunit [Marivibrio halodurans]MBP5856270.1 phage terminase large subunit [Marivibrio halodurans]